MFLGAVAYLAVELAHLHPGTLAHPTRGDLRKQMETVEQKFDDSVAAIVGRK